MKVTAAKPFRTFRGTYKDSDLVFFEKDGRLFARARIRPLNPRSPDQLLIRTYVNLATKNWDTLTPVQRQAWQDYAEQYFTRDTDGEEVTPSGITAYVRANITRQALGLALTTDAPLEAPPVPLTTIAQVDALNPDTLGLTLTHGLAAVAGHQVIVRMTPAMLTTARTPNRTQLRYVRGLGPDSVAALPASGGTIQFTPTRYAIQDGQRYGVEARIVRTADGITSTPLPGDFLKVV